MSRNFMTSPHSGARSFSGSCGLLSRKLVPSQLDPVGDHFAAPADTVNPRNAGRPEAEFLQHMPGCGVVKIPAGREFFRACFLEGKAQHRTCCLGGIALSPIGTAIPVAELAHAVVTGVKTRDADQRTIHRARD